MPQHARPDIRALLGDEDDLPAAQQPRWRHHPAYARTRDLLAAAAGLVSPQEVHTLRQSLREVATGGARVLQLGDCAESFFECTPMLTLEKLAVLDQLAEQLTTGSGLPTVRIGRMGGQFAKPRSQDVERVGELELPVFRGHMVNSEIPTAGAREHDPRRMLWAYQASAKVLGWVAARRGGTDAGPRTGPWASHEALVIDYERALVRRDSDTGEPFLASTHLPWIGERTRQLDGAHVGLLSRVANPVACKLGPTADPATVVRLCAELDPHRTPGRLVFITRLGHDAVTRVLPPLLRAVRRAGHPVVWLCDPMHGNTVRLANGVKTRFLAHMTTETLLFRDIVTGAGLHAGGLHLEVAAAEVAECVGGPVATEHDVAAAYGSLCDPRLGPSQARLLIEAWHSGRREDIR